MKHKGFALPALTKEMIFEPRDLVKYEVLSAESLKSLGLAAFTGSKTRPDREIFEFLRVQARKTRHFWTESSENASGRTPERLQ